MRYNVLCVDEFGMTRLEIANMIKTLDVRIINAKDELEALNILHDLKNEISVVIWTINSIDFKDFEAIKRIKAKDDLKKIPIMIISKLTDKKYVIKAIESGAAEYIAKPYDEAIVLRKLCKVMGIPFERASEKSYDEDILTFSFSEMLTKEIKSASRGNYPLSLVMASIVNTVKEEVPNSNPLNEIVDLINRVLKVKLRDTDLCFHYGINNLILILPFSDKEGCSIVEKRIRNIYETHTLIKQKNKGLELIIESVSFPTDGKIKEKLVEALENKLNRSISRIDKQL